MPQKCDFSGASHTHTHTPRQIHTQEKRPPNQQRTFNKLPPELQHRDFITKHRRSILQKTCVQRVCIPTELPFWRTAVGWWLGVHAMRAHRQFLVNFHSRECRPTLRVQIFPSLFLLSPLLLPPFCGLTETKTAGPNDRELGRRRREREKKKEKGHFWVLHKLSFFPCAGRLSQRGVVTCFGVIFFWKWGGER